MSNVQYVQYVFDLDQVTGQCADYNYGLHTNKGGNTGQQTTKGGNPVHLALYFESECGGCKQFITDQLYDVWQKVGSDVLNITLVPYGNTKVGE